MSSPAPDTDRSDADVGAHPAGSRAVRTVIEIVTTLGLAIVLYLALTTFVAQTFRVEQHSMIDSLQPGDHLIIDKLTPLIDSYSRGDIVVLHPGGDHEATPYIKRIIGLGGEHLELRDGLVWIDGVALDEEYTYRDPLSGEHEPTLPFDARAWDIPEGDYFAMGDHRMGSLDSRDASVGFVAKEDIIGRAVLQFLPRVGIVQTSTYPELEAD